MSDNNSEGNQTRAGRDATAEAAQRIDNFDEFFHYYLREHRQPACRATHYVGSSLGFLCWGNAIYTGQMVWVLIGFLLGYACAWIGHFFSIE